MLELGTDSFAICQLAAYPHLDTLDKTWLILKPQVDQIFHEHTLLDQMTLWE